MSASAAFSFSILPEKHIWGKSCDFFWNAHGPGLRCRDVSQRVPCKSLRLRGSLRMRSTKAQEPATKHGSSPRRLPSRGPDFT